MTPNPTKRDLDALAPLVDAAESLVRPQCELSHREQQARFEADHYRGLVHALDEELQRTEAEAEKQRKRASSMAEAACVLAVLLVCAAMWVLRAAVAL